MNINLYNNDVYPDMTVSDVEKMDKLNKKNHYGISYDELIKLAKRHRAAKKRNDLRTMSKIIYRLTDINFHHECSLMTSGEYDILINECKNKIDMETDKIVKEMENVKVGDIVICYDEYSHDYIEHKIKVESIEKDDEEIIKLFGTDLEYEDDEDFCIAYVHPGNFIKVAE